VVEMRVTIDIDTKGKEAGEAFRKLSEITKGLIEIWETRRGFHFIVRGLPISFEESLRIREECGDDPLRLRLDREMGDKPKQVLWTVKDGHVAKRITTIQFRNILKENLQEA
jgi:hypothetical protein